MIVYLVIVFIVTLLATFIVRKIALRRNIIDIPNPRSSHEVPTPRGGGLAITLSWFSTITFLYLQHKIPDSLFYSLLCALPVSITGLIDDIITISPKFRLAIQTICAACALYFIGGIFSVDIGFTHLFSSFIFNFLAVIGIVWFTNLFNFLDGIDGYIGSEVIFICLAVFLLKGIQLPLFLAASVAGFLVWNWQPAKIFMGDVGSTLLGFTIGIFLIYYQSSNESSVIIWLVLTSLFWFDASLTLFRRWKNKESLSKAHKKHAYQRLVQSGFSHQKTVIFSIIINITLMGLVWLSIKFPVFLLSSLIISMVYMYLLTRIIDKRYPFKHLSKSA